MMKMPNGYGTVVKMSGGRKKNYGVRITVVERDQNGILHHKKKWVGFFETQFNEGRIHAEIYGTASCRSESSLR